MSTAARTTGTTGAAATGTTGHDPAAPQVTGAGLRLTGVRKTFGDQEAIRSLDLDVRPGEFLSLLGPSGCGKTTLLRMIAGFETPTAGAIELDGRDLVDLPAHRRPVNTVFQSYALFPHMSVADNVAYGLKRARTPRRDIGPRVLEALRMVRMEDFARRRPAQLSGGQQQRIALARALVNRPRVLLLDEPMSALDRKLREDMQLELIRLHTELGLTFVFVTHDQEEALAMSDRIVVMRDGQVRQLGTAEEIYGSPADAFVAGFIGRQNFVHATVTARAGETARLDATGTPLEVPAAALPGGTDRVLVAVRPEKTRIAPIEAPGADGPTTTGQHGQPNTVDGLVIGESFLGDVVQYLVRTAAGTELLARVPAHDAPPISEHEWARLSWSGADAAVFPDE